MGWHRRFLELLCAGGALTPLTACPQQMNWCGNANPDPCICGRTPADSPQCKAESACSDGGGTWEFFEGSPNPPIEGYCVAMKMDAAIGPDASVEHDASIDAPSDGPHAIPAD